MFLSNRNTPRWIILAIDVATCLVGLLLAYLVRFEFNPPALEVNLALRFLPVFLSIRILSFVIGRTYAGIIRYTSTQDTLRIFTVLTTGSILFGAANLVKYQWGDGQFFIPNSIIILEYLLTLFIMVVGRIAVKVLYLELKTPSKARRRAVIIGAGESGLITKRAIDRDTRSGIEVIAFLDEDRGKSGKKLEGADIWHSSKSEELFASGKVDELILAVPSMSPERKSQIIELALKHDIKVLNVPPVKQWIGGQLSARQIRDVRIEDLLGRETIRFESEQVRNQLRDKVILVTGAAGSIGSELVRQVLQYNPRKVILLDQAESPLFELQGELLRTGMLNKCELVIGDVRKADRMRRMMAHFHPQVIYHAAAYKHVPLMEDNPSEAMLANVQGTKVMVDLADEFGVETFVLISTDKAVNPTSVMGATKRVAEMYAQSRQSVSRTRFITTRFGNVLGSSGSVIPIFRKQIEEGGPVTVTHPEVTRFFMTIPEASLLVLEAGAMGSGGEIFAFDMGASVRIADLARNMIRLSGFEPDKEIAIRFTGLRPGEKLFEEVLSDQEQTVPTHHPRILKARVREYPHAEVKEAVDQLIALFDKQDNLQIVAALKGMVPEYVSNNSVFERLDQ
ncbi:MAG: polysaccharide biosynthesis protein [Flavobacteriales bacterium]